MMPNGWPLEDTDTELPMTSELPLEDAPSAFDWREKGTFTTIEEDARFHLIVEFLGKQLSIQ